MTCIAVPEEVPITIASCKNVLRSSFAQGTPVMAPKPPPVDDKPCLCKKRFVTKEYQRNYFDKAQLGSSLLVFTL